jgi:anti-sigma factor RsiW
MIDGNSISRDSRLLELLRLEADGEISDAQRASLESMLATNELLATTCRRHIAAEQRLRSAVARVAGSTTSPVAVRSAVLQAVTEAARAPAPPAPPVQVLARIDRSGVTAASQTGSWWSRPFAAPHRANFAAVAAVLALITGAVLFGIFGRTIDDVPAPVVSASDVVSRAAEYADGEHGECTVDVERLHNRAAYASAADAEALLTEALGTPVRVFDLSARGYEFIGAGRCAVPLEKQPSGHLIYRKSINGQPGPMVSIFVAPARGCCKGICSGMRPREWMSALAASSSCRHKVLYSTDGALVYFLVCCDDGDVEAVAQTISRAQAAAAG